MLPEGLGVKGPDRQLSAEMGGTPWMMDLGEVGLSLGCTHRFENVQDENLGLEEACTRVP